MQGKNTLCMCQTVKEFFFKENMNGHDDFWKFGISMMYDNLNSMNTIRPFRNSQVTSPLNRNPNHSSFPWNI